MIRQVASKERWAMALTTDQFPHHTALLQGKKKSTLSDDEIATAAALCREAARRVLGERLYDVQLVAALALYRGVVIEMKTGEGKTISSVVAIYLHALAGRGIHVVTVNDYLAKRDAEWMGEVFHYLGLSVGYIINGIDADHRAAAYRADVTYGTNNEFGFDYLRDNMAPSHDLKVQREPYCCIIDEVDSILIDEARTPLIISGAAEDDTHIYRDVNGLVRSLVECQRDPANGEYPDDVAGDFKLDEKNRHVSFTNQGIEHIEQMLLNRGIINQALTSGSNFEYIHYFSQAIRAHYLYKHDREYVVKDGRVQIVDEFTGRVLTGRRYSEGLHQAIEAKEGIPIARRSRTMATITLQNYFRLYKNIAGMTGTALTEERELVKIYGLSVAVIPTNYPIIRDDQHDLIYPDESSKFSAISQEVREIHDRGQPILIGTATIESSERLSTLFRARGLSHTVLNAKNHAKEAMIVAEAGKRGAITIATNMAGRGTDIKLGGHHSGASLSPEDIQTTDEVRQIGGLYVLGSERHESRRIDNQLRGRSGRQGDPGCSRFFISMDDQLMRLFGGGREMLKSLITKGFSDGGALNHPLITKSIERAQKRVEERNFEIRKRLLEFDDVLNEQRAQIYLQRDDILRADTLQERIMNSIERIIGDTSAPYIKSGDSHDRQHALTRISEILYYPLDRLQHVSADTHGEQFRETLRSELAAYLQRKRDTIGADTWNKIIRSIYVRTIDMRWQDHLENLDALREAVYLRSYAQKDPLLEYKLEGFQLFDQLFDQIRNDVATRVSALRIEEKADDDDALMPHTRAALTTHHSAFGQFGALNMRDAPASGDTRQAGRPTAPSAAGAAGGAPAPRANAPQRTATVVRDTQKVGRNDPCPCGSGKKYKFCHGR